MIVRFEPSSAARSHTHWSDLSGTPDRPDHYQEVTWALVERDGNTELTIREVNLPSDGEDDLGVRLGGGAGCL